MSIHPESLYETPTPRDSQVEGRGHQTCDLPRQCPDPCSIPIQYEGTHSTAELLSKLGFTINARKSILHPSQSVEFVIDSTTTLCLPQEKVANTRKECQYLKNQRTTPRQLAHLHNWTTDITYPSSGSCATPLQGLTEAEEQRPDRGRGRLRLPT